MTKNELKIVFLGTPQFAIPSLEMLTKEGYNVAAVVTQPDKERGRGHGVTSSPVKLFAEEHGIEVLQYSKISREGVDDLKRIAPDLLITAAFGQILSQEVLDVPRLGCINVHGSLLPKYRGAAPIEWSIIDGEKITGITTVFTVYKLDAGDILESDELEIGEEETGGELRERMSSLGAKTLKRTLEKLLAGALEPRPQDEGKATFCTMFKHGFGLIDPSKPGRKTVDFIRGLNPAPCAYFMVGDDRVKVLRAEFEEGSFNGVPGDVICADDKKGLKIRIADGALSITELQFPGSKKMPARDFLRGKGKNVNWASIDFGDHKE